MYKKGIDLVPPIFFKSSKKAKIKFIIYILCFKVIQNII